LIPVIILRINTHSEVKMADKRYILAIDSGTQSIRVVLFDRDGNELGIEQAQYEPYFSLSPGWAEQRTEDYWSKLCRVCKGLMSKIKIDVSEIAAVGVTSQRNTVIPMDKEGNALRPGIIWLDQRTVNNPPPLPTIGKIAFGLMGKTEAVKYAQKNSKFLWIKENEPEIYAKTHKFVQVTGFFVKKLTDEFRDSKGMVTGIWPFDYKKLDWYGSALDFVYETFGIKKEHCVDLVEPNEIIGHITRKASQETGIPEGIPVVVGAGDKQCELLGAGAIDPSIAVISFGTATAMEVITRKYIEDSKLRFFTWPAAIPKTWDIEMFIYRGFWMVTWFKHEFGHREALEAEKRGVAPEAVLDEVIKNIPAGSMGLMIQPYWSPLVNDKYAKGSIIGFGDVHTRAHIYRAILEGIAFELRRMNEIVQNKTGVEIKEIRVGGGGSRSDVAVQIAADMFNLPTSRMGTWEISALGAAIDAAVGIGIYKSFEEAVKAMVRKGKTFEPNLQNHKVYTGLFNEVYKKSFEAMAPLNRQIALVTGYPPED
jgi:sugar (pentulose or hexulose) kinase